ncbi:MAG: SLC13 family permease [Proteobacteria bacterium]|nr:SLC13 family permease [Pseudomonadota bacterium]
MIGSLVVFIVTYLVIASRQLRFIGLDRPAGALVGAVAMVVVGGLPMDAALAAIDLHVLLLLFGVLLIAAYLHEAQFFRLAAYLVMTRATSARSLLFGLTFVAGTLSALLVNDTVAVVLTPLVVAVVVEARLPALPYLLALATATNVGGVVSFSGNPQNMIVGAAAHGTIGFGQYLAFTLLVGAACLVANATLIAWLFRKELPVGPLAERSPPKPAVDWVLAWKAIAALALFAGLAFAGTSLGGAAMCAAAVLMVVAQKPPKQAFQLVDWQLLVFFAGLFVVVAGVARAGLIDDLFAAVGPTVGRGDLVGDLAFLAFVVVASNVVSNVPLVMLAVASTLAGNLTLFGSVANIIVFEGAGSRGDIGFLRFLRIGALVTLLDLALAFGILGLERALGLRALLGL